jgi:CRISPR system Cascade subunit CasA
MPEKEFNLLREPWLQAMTPDGMVETVSLLDIFRNAPSYIRLAGELPTQDVAVLRLLLAVLHTVFSRYNLDGAYMPLYEGADWNPTPEDALDRWKALWERGAFPMDTLVRYLTHYEDRFYLFHPTHPFYQIPVIEKGTEYTAAKLNGELSESSNKIRLFPQRTGIGKNGLSYGEAARWLLYVNAFDDSSSKATRDSGVKLPSTGVGWLGKLGLVLASGNNLYETLLLNLVLLNITERALWKKEMPVWELDKAKTAERTPIPLPNNLSELLTLQSRRLMLKRDETSVIRYMLLGGDFYEEDDIYLEQMTLWGCDTAKKNSKPQYYPRHHNPDRQFWRDFSTLVVHTTTKRRPGVLNWLTELSYKKIIPRSLINIQTAAAQYDAKNCSIENIFNDSVSFNADLLNDFEQSWISRILGAIETADLLAGQAGWLAQNIAKAAGNTDEKGYTGAKNAAKERAYYLMDIPFRQWLASIDPKLQNEEVSKSEASDKWWVIAQRIVRELGRELAAQTGANAFIGRTVTENKNSKKTQRYTSPEAYNRFIYYTSNCEILKGGKKNGR